MGLLSSIKKKAKQWAKKATSGMNDNKANNKPPPPDATLGPSGGGEARVSQRMDADRRRRRGARGRDSTIITAGSAPGSRTLLG